MRQVRPPAVAGTFYPEDPVSLRSTVVRFLAMAEEPAVASSVPKAIIVPHAGYIYSGPVAARAYALLNELKGSVRRVILVGPAHYVRVQGIAVPKAGVFSTPLGPVTVDRTSLDAIMDLPWLTVDDEAHRREHSLEVQLPFLQTVLGSFKLVPLAVGDASPVQVAEVLDRLWGGADTLIVISSDLSHYHDDATAREMDAETAAAIERGDADLLDGAHACGYLGIAGLVETCRRRGLAIRRLDLRNSGDTAGVRREVVGYGAWAAAG